MTGAIVLAAARSSAVDTAAAAAGIAATTAGAISLVAGLIFLWKGDLPRIRTLLLVTGSVILTGGLAATLRGRAVSTEAALSRAVSGSITGTAIAGLGLVVLVILVGRAFWKKSISRWTSVAAALIPPLSAAAAVAGAGAVYAVCQLVAGVVTLIIGGGLHVAAGLASGVAGVI